MGLIGGQMNHTGIASGHLLFVSFAFIATGFAFSVTEEAKKKKK